MAYNADNLQISINHEKGIRRRWFYVSTDAKAVVLGASYISNAVAVGMKSGDSRTGAARAKPRRRTGRRGGSTRSAPAL